MDVPLSDSRALARHSRRARGDEHAGRPMHNERGQSLVELGILVPILLVIVLGAVDFGRAYYSSQAVANGARTGAQYAAVSTANAGNLSGITSAALQETGTLTHSPTVTATTGTDSRGKSYVRVTVSYVFTTIVAWPGLPHSVAMTRTVQMRIGP
jgi:Flp pilus assembly protein TadG